MPEGKEKNEEDRKREGAEKKAMEAERERPTTY